MGRDRVSPTTIGRATTHSLQGTPAGQHRHPVPPRRAPGCVAGSSSGPSSAAQLLAAEPSGVAPSRFSWTQTASTKKHTICLHATPLWHPSRPSTTHSGAGPGAASFLGVGTPPAAPLKVKVLPRAGTLALPPPAPAGGCQAAGPGTGAVPLPSSAPSPKSSSSTSAATAVAGRTQGWLLCKQGLTCEGKRGGGYRGLAAQPAGGEAAAGGGSCSVPGALLGGRGIASTCAAYTPYDPAAGTHVVVSGKHDLVHHTMPA